MSLMVPHLNQLADSEQKAMKEQFDRHHGTKSRHYVVGDAVFTKVFEKNCWSWLPGKVTARQGKVVYVVKLSDGRERVVHTNQIKRRLENVPEYTKESEWATTMWDIFELPDILESPSDSSKPMPSGHGLSPSRRTSTTVASSVPVPQSVPTMPTTTVPIPTATVPSQTTTVPSQTTTSATVQPRRTTRVPKPIVKYDPSVMEIFTQ
ncbi:hypothetical protein CAEBREN_09963 [Caenorhabditis brenneri]|uniref:Uncharacterized protein n=1 Tax=Caenorhabditis brenneri TaxID=135651 RepID=G0NJC5_CAEBE|nr:hypothetical protein CAEBREN_09963 [Caenorhabditis brenneri]